MTNRKSHSSEISSENRRQKLTPISATCITCSFRLVPKSTTLDDLEGPLRTVFQKLPRFRHIAGFLLRRATPPLFYPNFAGIPLNLNQIVDAVASKSVDPKLIIRIINFELRQPILPPYINVTDRRTNYDRNTALCTTCIAQ